MEKKYDIFISHASEEKNSDALPLQYYLARYGYNVWIDENQIIVSDLLIGKIEEGLDNSKVI